MKVLIVVRGGVVSEVYSSDEDVNIKVFDFDNAKSEGINEDQLEKELEVKTKYMEQVL